MDIRELLRREQAAGCHDTAVFGGFGAYLSQWAKDRGLPELAQLGERYAASPSLKRRLLLEEIERLLAGDEVSAAVVAAAVPEVKKSLSVKASEPGPWTMPISGMTGVGEKKAQLFARLGVKSVGDLLELQPRSYFGLDEESDLDDLQEGDTLALRGEITEAVMNYSRSRMSMLRCVIADARGPMSAVWYNQPYLQKRLRPGAKVLAWGRVQMLYHRPCLAVREYEMITGKEDSAKQTVIPVYPATAGLGQKALRSAIASAFRRAEGQIRDVLPAEICRREGFPDRAQTLRFLHEPKSKAEADLARRVLAYEELLTLQLAIRRNAVPAVEVFRPSVDDAALMQDFSAALPFSLTGAQARVIGEIFRDMEEPRPMTRLVQGDVGCGKTMVAAAAMLKCVRGGRQAAMMAPTELLARQHGKNLIPLFAGFGLSAALLTAHTPAGERRDILSRLKAGELDILIGTHAIIQEDVEFYHLGLAVTDEQHRFGVMQRARLRGAADADLLVMTATPIPRTLAMTLYGDMRLSLVDELPPGRKPVRTTASDLSYETRIHTFIDKQVAEGRQVYVVCPLIEDSEAMELDSAIAVYERLSKDVFPHRRVGLLHGRMKAAEKEQVMTAFRSGEVDILVSTTVIEVGVDVPNATVMLIRDAERFGLAQLHQLRGRVGRGAEQAFCILLHNARSDTARQRLDTICRLSDGLKLAEADLELRGPGEFFGRRQHGLPELRAADLFRDAAMLEPAARDAAAIAEGSMASTPLLEAGVERLLLLMA